MSMVRLDIFERGIGTGLFIPSYKMIEYHFNLFDDPYAFYYRIRCGSRQEMQHPECRLSAKGRSNTQINFGNSFRALTNH